MARARLSLSSPESCSHVVFTDFLLVKSKTFVVVGCVVFPWENVGGVVGFLK